MGLFRRLAFCVGLALGLATIAVSGAVFLTYLFTGKLPMVEMEEGTAGVQLMTPDQVAATVREQVDKAKQAQADTPEGGEDDDET